MLYVSYISIKLEKYETGKKNWAKLEKKKSNPEGFKRAGLKFLKSGLILCLTCRAKTKKEKVWFLY